MNKTIRLFLDSIGRRDEYEFYLTKFHAAHAACFALLCPDLESVETGAEVLAFDLHFLMRLELVPAILLCGADSERMQRALAKEPIFSFQSLETGAGAAEFIRQSKETEKVPVLVAESELSETLLELLPDVAKRIHFIRAAGGLKNADGEPLSYINTHRENFQPLEKLELDFPALGKMLIDACPGVHVSVTSPINLLQEIFTVKGSGTVFRKGSVINHFQGMENVDRQRLVELMEASFGRKLAAVSALDAACDFFIEQEYRGAVLLEPHPAGLYLSKFAVGKEARGEGVGVELWREVCRAHDCFFWRSNINNPFNQWYDKQADGRHAAGKWQIFWRGVKAESISDIIEYCCTRDEDFIS
ncbi:MAG: hypothetical protein K9M45_09775 [Kiritimatiellales bacterium]|nr:hypothetical protein [Kiritimatiellales bacterium]